MPQIVVLITTIILMGLIFNPIRMINFYFFVRPLLMPWGHDKLQLVSLPINWPIAAGILLCTVIYFFTSKRFKITDHNLAWLYMITGLSIVSWAYTVSLSESIGQTIKFVNAICLVLLVINIIKKPKDAYAIYSGIVTSSILPMIYGYYQVVTNTGEKGIGGAMNRATSVLGFSNLYGIFLAFITLFSILLFLRETSRNKKIYYFAIFISSIISGIVALNRGTWLALFLALVFAYPFYREKLQIKWFLIGFLLIGLAASSVIISRFSELNEDRAGADTLKSRTDMWEVVLENYKEFPPFGYGTGTARTALRDHYNIDSVPHNDYLRFFIELGPLGSLLYITFLGREVLYNIKNCKRKRYWQVNYITLVIIFYWSIISFVQNGFHDVVVFPMFLMSLYIAKRFNKMDDLQNKN
jgi:hypothetical protein